MDRTGGFLQGGRAFFQGFQEKKGLGERKTEGRMATEKGCHTGGFSFGREAFPPD
jgi:hypothetical protein